MRVNVDNFKRAESDYYFGKLVAQAGGLGKFNHLREPVAIDRQDVIRMNRDTLYSSLVADLDASDITITLPDAGKRFMSKQVINEDHYTPMVVYKSGAHAFTKAQIGTRYVVFAVRTFVDPDDPSDLKAVHTLQDSIKVPVQFGDCDDDAVNCLPITPGWNYLVRMYRPRKEILDGSWVFPEATPVA